MAGYTDPVADYLREAVDEHGALPGDYREVLDGVAAITGCAADTRRTFIPLSNLGYTPRPIHIGCADDPAEASRFFMVMDGVTGDPDIDPQELHMVGWDEEAGEYHRYATYRNDDGDMAVNVAPGFCLGCHGGPERLPYWQPLMNVMTSPWSQWNASPGFASHLFDELLDDAYRGGEVFAPMLEHAESASRFEPIVRAGIDRVTGARLRQREQPAQVSEALELVRPLFCDEMVNYVSEVHASGELRASAAIDDGLRSLIARARPDLSLGWLGATALRLPPPSTGQPELALVPVRGESNVELELGLVARGALTAEQALRVRAIDWTHPVASQARCDLYRRGRDRVLERDWSAAGDTNGELVGRLVDEILSELSVPDGADLVAIRDGARWQEREPMTIEQLAAAIDSHLAALERADVDGERHRRTCAVTDVIPFAPMAPDVSCD